MSGKTAALLPYYTILCLIVVCQSVTGWENPEMVEPSHQIRLNDTFEWHKLEPTELGLLYDATELDGDLVLNLFGYSERNATKISKIQTPFTLLSTAAVPASANGELDVMKLGLKCIVNDDECNKYDIGFVQITPEKGENFTKKTSFITQIIPLGWFLHQNYLKENFANWPVGRCTTWFKSEKDLEGLPEAMKAVSCPITMLVAMSDPGWYLKSTYLAGFPIEETRSGNSTALPAQQCFYSAIENIPANMHAAPASMCCYRTSDSSLLTKEFVKADNPLMHGSSVLRSHPFGSDNHHEHYLPGQVPYLSHWYWDKLPYLHCCLWWKGNTCADHYMKLRPTPKIKRKPAGSSATYVVDSHIKPIGSTAETFCPDVGEYWLVRSPTIEVQIRNYVVSSYTGSLPLTQQFSYGQLRVAGSKSAFVTAVAVRSMDAPKKIVELICPEGEFRSYVQATNRDSQTSEIYEGRMGRAVGTNIVVGDALVTAIGKVYSILVKHSLGRIGINAFVVMPGEEFMNLYVTITEHLAGNVTGLAAGGECSDNKITDSSERLFSSNCDNCEDFAKYSTGRPLYYEPFDNTKVQTDVPGIDCLNDPRCRYITWSTNLLPYYQAIQKSKTHGIVPLLAKLDYTGWDVCQKPDITGLYISETQSFNESATMELKCLEPLTTTSTATTATCKKSGDELAFDYPSDFVCAESVEVKAEEVKAQQADTAYTQKHYSPEAKAAAAATSATAADAAKKIAPASASPETLTVIISLALTGLFRRP